MYEQTNTSQNPYDTEYMNAFFKAARKTQEKREIRRSAAIIGFPLLAILVITRVWSFAYMFVMRLLGFGERAAYDILVNPANLQLAQVLLSMLMFTLPFVIAVRSQGGSIAALVPFKKTQEGLFLPFFLMGMGFCAFSNIATSIAGGIFESLGFEYNLTRNEDPNGIFGFLLCVVATAIVPGLVEEFAIRGVTQGVLLRFGEAFSILTSAIIFGVMHGNFSQAPFAFVIGLALGFIRIKTGSLWICVAIHTANNLISVLMSFLTKAVGAAALDTVYGVYLIAALICFAAGVLMLKNWKEDLFVLAPPPSSVATAAQKFKWLFTSVPVILFLVICLIDALSYF